MPRVYLAVGHGIKPDGTFDPGASGGGTTEQEAGDLVAAACSAVLRAHGIDVTSEENSHDPNYVGTVKAANRGRYDLVVALHHDWIKGVPAVFGFWYPGSKAGQRATRSIVGACGRAGFPVNHAWTKPRSLYLLRKTKAPAALIEYRRVGDNGPDELEALGVATAHGILAHLGVPVRKPAAAPAEADTTEWTAEVGMKAISGLVKHAYGTRFDPGDVAAVVRKVAKALR